MSITASDVAKLRSLTGAGMMDCKKALDEAGGDMEKAGELLRKKGIVKAAKRTDKIAAEGATQVKVNGNTAVVLEVNSETDFVAQNEDFKNLVNELTDNLLENKPAGMEEAMSPAVAEKINNLTAKIGEKIALRRFAVMEKTDADAFGAYSHLGGKISVLVVLKNSAHVGLATDIAMHAAASNPKYVSRDQVPAEMIAKELEQPFIKDEEKTIQKLLGESISIAQMERFELGAGLVKETSDFAAEVEAQLK